MTDEEKKALETLKEVASDEFDTLGDDISPKMAENILNVIDKQQKEIEEKTTILLAGAEKVKQLEKEIEELKSKYKDLFFQNFELWEKNIFPMKAIREDYISKDKIREKLKELEEQFKKYENEGLSGFVSKIDKGTRIEVLKELLEEK